MSALNGRTDVVLDSVINLHPLLLILIHKGSIVSRPSGEKMDCILTVNSTYLGKKIDET